MNKRETARRLARARRGVADIRPIGTTTAKVHILRQHGDLRLPQGDIFAFVANGGTPDETHVIVGERHARLEIVGCVSKGDMAMSDTKFDCLLETALKEAIACQVKSPMSITFSNKRGVFAFPYDSKKKRGAA